MINAAYAIGTTEKGRQETTYSELSWISDVEPFYCTLYELR
jgi:hypothetical protein